MTEYPPPRENEPNVPLGKNPDQPQPPGGPYPPPDQYPPPGGPSYPPPPGGQQYAPPPGQYPPPGGPFYPPPPGQYPPPQGNQGFPPPPPVGQYPQAPGYQPPPGFGAPPELSVGAAISYGWAKFKDNAVPWIAVVLLSAVVSWFVSFAFSGFTFTYDYNGGAAVLSLVGSIVSFIVSVLFKAALTRGSLDELDGRKPDIAAFFNLKNLSAVFIIAIIVGIATMIGFILLIIPGLIVMFLTWYALPFALDHNQDAITAIKSSYELTSKHFGSLFLLALACVGLNIVGAILCLVGLLVTIPITLIASTYAYRVLTGGQVSAPV